MKTKLLALIITFLSLRAGAVNVTIIESLTGNSWAVQDTMWRNVALGMGYHAVVVPQSALDSISSFDTTDVLLVSSGTISYSGTNHLQTIREFVLSGRSTYIQSEYQPYFQGVITFDSLMQMVGANFSWTGTVSGQLAPMNILGVLSTTPNNVTQLSYFNYGYAGVGTGVEKFLEFNGAFFGFCYSDTSSTNGMVITISDEDWAWQNFSPQLMENILYRLAHAAPSSVKNMDSREASVKIFPNPCTVEATITSSRNLKRAVLTVYDAFGNEVRKTENLSGMSFAFAREHLANGLYFIRISEENKIIGAEKIIVTGN